MKRSIKLIIDGMYDLDQNYYFSKDTLSKFEQIPVDYCRGNADTLTCFTRIIQEDTNHTNEYAIAGLLSSNKQYLSYGFFNIVQLKDDMIKEYKYIYDLNNQNITDYNGYKGILAFNEVLTYEGINPASYNKLKYHELLKTLPIPLYKKIIELNKLINVANKEIVVWPYYFKPFRPITYYYNNECLIGYKQSLLKLSSELGMNTYTASAFTGLDNTNLLEKKALLFSKALNYDTTYLHLDGCDYLGHQKNKKAKITLIKQIEKDLIIDIIKFTLENNINFEMIVDHICDSTTGLHYDNKIHKLRLKG